MKNVPEFDGLRGYLSTFIVITHIYYPLLGWALGTMDIFFALSAYLIGSGVIKNQNKPGFYKTYIKRRIFRIWPSYYFLFFGCLVLSFMATKFGRHEHLNWFPLPETLQSMFFLQRTEQFFCFSASCAHTHYSTYLFHTWSVALEEQFYVLVLFIVWALSIFQRPVVLTTILTIFCMIAEIAARYEGASAWVLSGRFDPFAVGILLAFLMSHVKRPGNAIQIKRIWFDFFLIISVFPIIALYTASTPSVENEGPATLIIFVPTVFSVFGFFLLESIHTHTLQRRYAFLRWKFWVELGEMSYSTYLWHMPVLMIIGALIDREGITRDWKIYPVEFLACFVVSRTAYVLIERPFRRIGKK